MNVAKSARLILDRNPIRSKELAWTRPCGGESVNRGGFTMVHSKLLDSMIRSCSSRSRADSRRHFAKTRAIHSMEHDRLGAGPIIAPVWQTKRWQLVCLIAAMIAAVAAAQKTSVYGGRGPIMQQTASLSAIVSMTRSNSSKLPRTIRQWPMPPSTLLVGRTKPRTSQPFKLATLASSRPVWPLIPKIANLWAVVWLPSMASHSEVNHWVSYRPDRISVWLPSPSPGKSLKPSFPSPSDSRRYLGGAHFRSLRPLHKKKTRGIKPSSAHRQSDQPPADFGALKAYPGIGKTELGRYRHELNT